MADRVNMSGVKVEPGQVAWSDPKDNVVHVTNDWGDVPDPSFVVNSSTGDRVKGWASRSGEVKLDPSDAPEGAIPIWTEVAKFDKNKIAAPRGWEEAEKGEWNEQAYLDVMYQPYVWESLWSIGEANRLSDESGKERDSFQGDVRTATYEDWVAGKYADSWAEYQVIKDAEGNPYIQDGKVLMYDNRTRGGSGLFGVVDDLGERVGLGEKVLTRNLGRDAYGASDIMGDFMGLGMGFVDSGLVLYGRKGAVEAEKSHADWGVKDYSKFTGISMDVGSTVVAAIASIYLSPYAGSAIMSARQAGKGAEAELMDQDARWANIAGNVALSFAMAYVGEQVGSALRTIANPAVRYGATIASQSALGAAQGAAVGGRKGAVQGAVSGAASSAVGGATPTKYAPAASAATSYTTTRAFGGSNEEALQASATSALQAYVQNTHNVSQSQKLSEQSVLLSSNAVSAAGAMASNPGNPQTRANFFKAYGALNTNLAAQNYTKAGEGWFGPLKQQGVYNSNAIAREMAQYQAQQAGKNFTWTPEEVTQLKAWWNSGRKPKAPTSSLADYGFR